MSDPPLTFDIRSLQEDGHLGGIDESLGLVLVVSVIDSKEFDEIYSAGGEGEFFVDDHDERE